MCLDREWKLGFLPTCIADCESLYTMYLPCFRAISLNSLFIHNISDLPGQSALSPESLYPGLLCIALVGLWLVPPARRAATWVLLVWGTISLVGGGILSVLPLGLFPFSPEQTPRHYAFHALYAITQIPLIWVCIARLRHGPKRSVVR